MRGCTLLALCGAAVSPALGQVLPAHARAVNAGAAPGGNGLAWQTAFNTLQAGLAAASASGGAVTELWVAQGEYGGSSCHFAISNVSLYGGFAGNEISKAQRPPGTLSSVICSATSPHAQILTVNTTLPVTIDRFFLASGSGVLSISGPTTLESVSASSGGSFSLKKIGSAPLTIRNSQFASPLSPTTTGITVAPPADIRDSSISAGGWSLPGLMQGVTVRNSQLHFHSEHTPFAFVGCTFEDCTITALGGGTPTISGSQFVRTSIDTTINQTGRALSVGGSHFDGCTLSGFGVDGGIQISGGTIGGTKILSGLSIGGSPLVVNSIVSAAVRPHVAGASAPHFVNCFFSRQGSPFGALITVAPGWEFSNCIFWASGQTEANLFEVPAGMTGFINHSIVRGWTGQYGGVGNSGAAPMLDQNGRPLPGSPAIDAGSNAPYPAGFPYDFDGNCRVSAGVTGGPAIIDIGPFEFSSCYANCDCSTVSPALNVADFVCFLQRFTAGDSWANCDGSTAAPVLNVADFACFVQKFIAGCP